jgi:hypothetical protein
MERALVAAADRANSEAAKGDIIAYMRCIVTVSADAIDFTDVVFGLCNLFYN